MSSSNQEDGMTAQQAKMFGYHLGIVVRDREAACERYSELLGVPEWHYSEIERPRTS